MSALALSVTCTDITETYEKEKTQSEDFGFSKSTAPKKSWVAKFEVVLGKKRIKIALAYETEAEVRRFAEGHTYKITTWLTLAFA